MTNVVAVLMTCYNRRETTLSCLRKLEAQAVPAGWGTKVYLVDDGSTDGTAAAVASAHPNVVVLEGTGELYWTGGMMMADQAAMAARPSHLLWLNDDVDLAASAITTLIDASQATKGEAIIVGTTVDADSKAATYGGYRRAAGPLDLELIEPNGQLQRVDTMNGNVVLVPRMIRERLGTLDCRFQHNMSDMDYGFRAVQTGFEIVVAPQAIGTCRKNATKARWSDPSATLNERIRAVLSFRGLPPRQWLRFTARHTGWWWPRYFVGPYVRVLLPRWQSADSEVTIYDGLKGSGFATTVTPEPKSQNIASSEPGTL